MARADVPTTMYGAETVAILGLGLVGGSIARDLSALGYHVLAYDRDAATLDAACAAGVVDERLDASFTRLGGAEIVIIAVPVSSLRDVLAAARLYVANARLIMDVGSTKRSAIAAAESVGLGDRFVGSHPMAGGHRSGWPASRRGLFAGGTVYLCPTKTTRGDSLELACQIWSRLEANPHEIDAETHDRRVAYASHLPQAASTALALTLAEAGVTRQELGPGGHDVTRLAGSSVEMWTAIALDNSDALVPAVTALESRLAQLRRAIERSDREALRDLFGASRAWADKNDL